MVCWCNHYAGPRVLKSNPVADHMRFLPFFIITLFLAGFACQKNYQHLFLRLDTQIYNSNFPVAESFNQEGVATTMVIGTNGIQSVATRSVDVDTPNGRFRFSLVDMNQNNLFAEPGIDLLVLSPYQQQAVPINLGNVNVGLLRPSNIIQVDRHFYLVQDIDSGGQSVELVAWERAPRNTIVANLQTRMNQVPVHDLAQEDTYLPLRSESGKATLLLVWNYQESSLSLIRELEAQKQLWEEDWEVITVNMQDDPGVLTRTLEQMPLSFPTYLMSSKSCQVLDCHALPPYAILLDKQGRIIQQGVKAPGLWTWLDQLGERKANS